MMEKITRRRMLALFAIASFVRSIPARSQGLATFPKSKLTIKTSTGAFKFNIELAVTEAQMSQGLMYRRKMTADAGMLFDYKRRQRVLMWMKNTFIPLDMLFIGSDGRIVNIVERTIPHSVATISSKGRVQAVLELNGGTVSRLGIKPGDVVIHDVFGNQ